MTSNNVDTLSSLQQDTQDHEEMQVNLEKTLKTVDSGVAQSIVDSHKTDVCDSNVKTISDSALLLPDLNIEEGSSVEISSSEAPVSIGQQLVIPPQSNQEELFPKLHHQQEKKGTNPNHEDDNQP